MEDKSIISEGYGGSERPVSRRGVLKYFPIVSLVFFAVGVVSAGLYAGFVLSVPFADFFNENVSPIFRFILAKLTYIFPFSVAEAVLLTLPVTLFLLLRAIFAYMDREEHGFTRSAVTLLSTAFLLFSVFVFTFAAGYRGSTLDKKLGFEVGAVTPEALEETAYYVTDKLNYAAESVTFCEDGSSIRGYTHAETVERATASYEKLCHKYDFITTFKAPVKRLAVSPVMTYTHISGVYSFFTGEANLNTNYPEFVNVFTIAHEMAHQRGISRENEANFVAYLICIDSDDPYMQYAGYLNMFEYLVAAVPRDTAKELYSALRPEVLEELRAYSRFFDKYRDSTASEVSGTVNNVYLQSQGTPGTKSYGMVVDLAVDYHKADVGK